MQTDVSGPTLETIHQQISTIFDNPAGVGWLRTSKGKRRFIDRILRYLAFDNREKFSNLKHTPLVHTWEKMTDQRW
jgi:hypothetical protein